MMDPEQKLGAEDATQKQNSSVNSTNGQSHTMVDPDNLHNLFATTEDFDGTDEDDPLAQLRSDPNYSALIRDLEYIAKEARALFQPADETPSDELWSKIQSQLPAKPDPS